MDQKIKNLIKKVESGKEWFNTNEASEIAGVSTRCLRYLPNLKRKKSNNNRYVYIHKSSVADVVKRNESAILNWVKREDIGKELGVGWSVIKNACHTHGIRQKLDVSNKERVHPDDIDKLKYIIKNGRARLSDIIRNESGVYYSLIKTTNDYMENRGYIDKDDRDKTFNKKYKTFYRWLIIEKNNNFNYYTFGNKGHHQIYVDKRVYEIISNSITVRGAAKVLKVSSGTVRNLIKRGYIRRHEVSKRNGILNRNDVIMSKHLPYLIPHLRNREIDFMWSISSQEKMWDGEIKYAYNGGPMSDVLIYVNNILVMSLPPEDFRKIFSERVREDPYAIGYNGELVIYFQIFLLLLFKKDVKYKLI